VKITLLDAAVLMHAAIKAAERKDIGWLDADKPLNVFRMRLNQKIDVERTLVESALSCLIELDEIDELKHPDGLNAATFIQKITPWGERWDSRYRLFEKETRK
jgi:hypothetical protein